MSVLRLHNEERSRAPWQNLAGEAVSLLPCDGDLATLGIVSGGFLNREALGEHLGVCRSCASVYRAMAAAVGARGGKTRGAAKGRGSSEHYRGLAALSWSASK